MQQGVTKQLDSIWTKSSKLPILRQYANDEMLPEARNQLTRQRYQFLWRGSVCRSVHPPTNTMNIEEARNDVILKERFATYNTIKFSEAVFPMSTANSTLPQWAETA